MRKKNVHFPSNRGTFQYYNQGLNCSRAEPRQISWQKGKTGENYISTSAKIKVTTVFPLLILKMHVFNIGSSYNDQRQYGMTCELWLRHSLQYNRV